MATKTIRICDITGEELTSPVNIGFTLEDGTNILFEVNQKTASKFVVNPIGKFAIRSLICSYKLSPFKL